MRDASDDEDIRKVEEFLRGDSKAFEFLFDKYHDKVYSIAYRFVRNREDALDVAQEVFLRVHLGLGSFKSGSRFFTWLYRIAVNRAIDFTRRRKVLPISGSESFDLENWAEDPGRRTPSPLEVAQEREIEERLAEAVSRLSPKHRAVFVLHASENLSYKEIAEVLDCNIGTVMSRLFYARKKLQEILAGFGFDLLGTQKGR
ncbi:MAG: sigma-70 family RNA polymerase sigma factor [Planctomycetes bacterium]|nr:sigma-70 family RNA polymerase sigma factor [Planctomycetota bacterium]